MVLAVPYLRTPFTDLTGTIGTCQGYGRCRDFEMRLLNCMEAYGHTRGLQVCGDLMDDFHECHYRHKQKSRLQIMQSERKKQNVYEPPPREDACP